MSNLFETAIVEKRNILNELRSNNMTLQELRFFCIYLSKINPWDKSTRVVRFPLDDFRKLMNLGTDMNMAHFKLTVRRILQQVVEVPNENGSGYSAFQLFKKAVVEKDENYEWYVEFNAHDDALPLMFDFKNRYFKYEIWNALRLKSPNQLRMYEILKQYEGLGKRELSVPDLRSLLGIGVHEYKRWSNFRKKVLDSCQQALNETTDICYTYERGKTGKGGKWLTIIFHITKNKDYVDPISLKEFIAQQPKPEPLSLGTTNKNDGFVGKTSLFDDDNTYVQNVYYDNYDEDELRLAKYGDEKLAILAEAVKDEFSKEEMESIDLVLSRIDIPRDQYQRGVYAIYYGRQRYLREKYAALNAEAAKKERKGQKPIADRFKYFLGMLENDTFQPAAYKD